MRRTPPIPLRHRGFSIVEVALSLAIVGVMLTAALRTVGAARVGQQRDADRARAALLAQDLMSEIVALPYADPEGGTALGIDALESTGVRSAFDDVDDYDGWNESPPQSRTGAAMAGWTGWRRRVAVEFCNASNPGVASLIDTGAKRSRVQVLRNGVELARLVAVRTSWR